MHLDIEDLIKIVFAVLAGGFVGFERELKDKAAGLRTLIFICVGSTIFTILSAKLAHGTDPTRISANIISGIGFLGAGAILRERGRVLGLTTASTIWLVAALGMIIGGGLYVLAFSVVVGALFILWFFPELEKKISQFREERNYEITCQRSDIQETELLKKFREFGLNPQSLHQEKTEHTVLFYWRAIGSQKAHDQMIHYLMTNSSIKEFHV